jgi:DnaJ-class molecular chaperone
MVSGSGAERNFCNHNRDPCGGYLALIVEIEAAMQLGITIKLLRYFTKKCPKYGESRLLHKKEVDGIVYHETDDILSYQRYLSEPWPKRPDSERPHIPDAIKEDVKAECHLACAICGDMNRGEVAHIEAVAATANNSPENLVFLCPNHHTEYDLGFKPNSNVSLEALKAAKLLKREARVRMLRYEANAYKAVASVLSTVKKLEGKLRSLEPGPLIEVYETELSALMRDLPAVLETSQAAARKDTTPDNIANLINKAAPTIVRATNGLERSTSSTKIRNAATTVIAAVETCLVELDEVECPHCGGRGTTGLVGDYCAYCKGDMVVSEEQADAYDPDEINETDCPHCAGRGLTGIGGFLCGYCRGSCKVSRPMAQMYDPDEMDEVDCPHCLGRGITGYSGDICSYCDGACRVSSAVSEAYNRDDIDEVNCPHCNGRGLTGRVGDICHYCRGSQVVSHAKADAYDRDEIDEVDCPHCKGHGLTGLQSQYCSYCKGSQVVSRAHAEEYDPDEIDEVDCPRCNGSGTTGLRGTYCSLCKGTCSVTRDTRQAYWSKYGRRD